MDNKNQQASGIELIAQERKRQIEVEGWDAVHDNGHNDDELAIAAGCYALTPCFKREVREGLETPKRWPWDEEWWKPSKNNRIKELIKAGALIAAEIDRLNELNK